MQCDNGLCKFLDWQEFAYYGRNFLIMAGIFSIDNMYSTGKTPLLVGDILVDFGDILSESKSSAC